MVLTWKKNKRKTSKFLDVMLWGRNISYPLDHMPLHQSCCSRPNFRQNPNQIQVGSKFISCHISDKLVASIVQHKPQDGIHFNSSVPPKVDTKILFQCFYLDSLHGARGGVQMFVQDDPPHEGSQYIPISLSLSLSKITSIPSFLPPPSLDMQCYLSNVIQRQGTPFEVMTGRTAFIYGLLAEVFRGFPQP